MLDLLEVYRRHCPFNVEDPAVQEYKTVYRAHCFGVYDALRSVAAEIGNENVVKQLEQEHSNIVNETL